MILYEYLLIFHFFQPTFSDDSHQVVTPPAAEPMPLISQNLSADQDQTIPINTTNSIDLFQHDNDVTLVKDAVTGGRQFTPQQNQPIGSCSINNNGVETPKSALLKTHKRMSSTVLIKKEKRQMVGEKSNAQHKKQQQIDEKVEEERPSVCIPESELEASTLLDDIKERRVSAVGLTDTQVLSLAKLIATMTGTDENLVYQLISLLPKKEDYSAYSSSSRVQSSRSSIPGKQSTTYAGGQNTPMLSYATSNSISTSTHNSIFRGSSNANGSIQKVVPYQDHSGKPISSVIPINADRTFSQHQDMHRPPRDTLNYMQSTRIPERYSDPQPLFERAQTEQRLAVSVSPVRNNVRNNCVLTPSYAGHYIPPNTMEEGVTRGGQRASFVPLSQVRSSNESLIRASDVYEYGNFNMVSNASSSLTSSVIGQKNVSSFGSISNHDSLIHADSIVYPRNVDFDVCCTGGTPTTQIVRMQNTNKCWMQVQLQVAFFAYNGREVSF